jgi:predicted amidohydrolase YtcJ
MPPSILGDDWNLGRGWNYAKFRPEAHPHKKYLDEICPDRPVFLEGYDGHTYWPVLKALVLDRIVREPSGRQHF